MIIGAEDINTIVQFTLSRDLFTEEEINEFEKKAFELVSSTSIHFGECEIYHLTKEYENIIIDFEMFEVE